MAKKLKQSLVPEGIDYQDWIINAPVKDLVAEMQFRNDKLRKLLVDPAPKVKKKNDRKR